MLAPTSSWLKEIWRQRVVAVVRAQLSQGFTPGKIALTVALGVNLGIIPILGCTTLLCGLAGFWLKLNQPVIQLVNWLAAPLQLMLILVFIRLGEWLAGAPRLTLALPELLRQFHASPAGFLRRFGGAGLEGVLAWLLIAPLLTAVIYFALLPPLKRLSGASRVPVPPPAV